MAKAYSCFPSHDAEPAVDGGSGMAEATLTEEEMQTAEMLAARTASDPESDPMTGAELGMPSEDEQAELLGQSR